MFQPQNDSQRAALRAYRNAIQTIMYTPGARLNDAAPEKAAALAAGMTLCDLDEERWNEAERASCFDPVNIHAVSI